MIFYITAVVVPVALTLHALHPCYNPELNYKLWNRTIYSLWQIQANKPNSVPLDKPNELIYIIEFLSLVIDRIRKHNKCANLAFEIRLS